MYIKLEDISTKRNNSTEISMLSNFNEIVEKKLPLWHLIKIIY